MRVGNTEPHPTPTQHLTMRKWRRSDADLKPCLSSSAPTPIPEPLWALGGCPLGPQPPGHLVLWLLTEKSMEAPEKMGERGSETSGCLFPPS